ncbi:hypothetical protein H9Y04_39960 [Streptomyces sp. TRM66268-LWL]|uniref:NYN domain-containing protein n=1 Tax=Streptomyces polyasparticus TaxID=2767826 RepID=A0ABR7SVN5_9ACTN|nr:DUF6086 family protein [Streptomyces polyasparticus]MBC9718720.1 hypothetical protein [Streptomyces polyasparticus]
MSMYFDIGDETLWNPSNGAGRLFLKQVEVFEAELGPASGIGQGKYWGDPDTLAIDPELYAEFTRSLVDWHCRTGHSVILALSEGFVATALALARRAGIEVEMPEPQSGHVCGGVAHDVQVPGVPRTGTVAAALDTRAREMDRGMAR